MALWLTKGGIQSGAAVPLTARAHAPKTRCTTMAVLEHQQCYCATAVCDIAATVAAFTGDHGYARLLFCCDDTF